MSEKVKYIKSQLRTMNSSCSLDLESEYYGNKSFAKIFQALTNHNRGFKELHIDGPLWAHNEFIKLMNSSK